MIDRDQPLAAVPHLALRRKQILRRGFVRHAGIRRGIPHPIDISGHAIVTADEAATFVGISLARVGDDVVKVSFCERYQSRFVNTCGSAT